jgi:HTH-type transcriptional regulator / antitoxin HipB
LCPAGAAAIPVTDNVQMAQGKRISVDIAQDALQTIKALGAAAKLARTGAGEGQAAAAARLGVHVQTIARIESGEPGVSVGHMVGLLALYGISVRLEQPGANESREP